MFHCVISHDAEAVRLGQPQQKLTPNPRSLLILKPSKPDNLSFLLYSLVVSLSVKETSGTHQ